MILIKHIKDLQILLNQYKAKNLSIGFVPTMGALHQGHISLIDSSIKNHPITVCSIFVNPTQFNNPDDFNKYPITIETDMTMLEAAGCDVLFLPSVSEMYPPGDAVMIYELGYIQTLLEGKFRPGHFQGVSRIVDKLIEFVQPDTLYLGQKDYQQCMVIKKMIQLRNYATQLQVCDTVREKDGLAMSSRNMRLNAEERLQALQIIHTLKKIKDEIVPGHLNAIKEQAMEMLSQHGFKVDYVEIADASHLEPIHFWDGKQPAIALIAAFINEVRLIDNLFIN